MSNDIQLFLFLLVLVVPGHLIGLRIRRLIAKRKAMETNADVFAACQTALLKKHIEQLDRAQLHGVPLEPLRRRMNEESEALLRSVYNS